MNGTPLLRPLLVGALVALAAHAPLSDRAAAQIPATGPFEVAELGVAELQAALLSGSVTCREIVAGYLQRIERYDRPSGLNAITEVHPAALAVADSIDRALAAGQPAGSLVCAPMLVKDNFDTADLPTTGGSIALAGSIPPDDAFMVRRLREAGAVLLAKTNMAEWAFSPRQSISSSYGRTANAYALDRVPAGSSGGTASGVAASLGVAGLGSDTGNSIRGPSSHLALVGIRSTIGLTSRDGVIPLAFDRDIAGPMGRTVDDVARILSVIAGHDPADPYTAPAREHVPQDYGAQLDAAAVRGRTLGVFGPYADRPGADPEIRALFEAALSDLERMGARVIPFELPDFESYLAPGNFCGRFRYDLARYLESLGEAAPLRDVTEILERGAFGPDAERGLRNAAGQERDLPPGEWPTPCPDFFEHPGRQAALQGVVAAMDQAGIDAFLFPTWSNPPAHIDRGNEEYLGDNSQGLIPVTGLPALTVPMGFTSGGLPAGLQWVGRPWSEGLLLSLGHAYEQATKHRRPPPLFPPLIGEGGTGAGG